MTKLGARLIAFLTGCFVYSFMEISSRGFTHWTMTLTGGIVMTILYGMFTSLRDVPLWQKCLLGSLIITAVEFSVGVIVNIILKWNVWNYSDMPFNILGQICLPFTLLWFFVCIPACFVSYIIRNRLEKSVKQ